jgi:hypothetical protein
MTHYEITSMAREAGLFVPRDGIPRDGALARFAAMAYAAGAAAELAALEQPEQEPVAWRWKAMVNGDYVSNWVLTHSYPPPYALKSHPLYTNPPRRLHAVNQDLLEALKEVEPILARMYGPQAETLPPMQRVRAAIARAEGEV